MRCISNNEKESGNGVPTETVFWGRMEGGGGGEIGDIIPSRRLFDTCETHRGLDIESILAGGYIFTLEICKSHKKMLLHFSHPWFD